MTKRKDEEMKQLCLGDLVEVSWIDASIGKSLVSGVNVDIAVRSWGVYLGLLGQKNKHIILVQNNFHYADGLVDLDYTAIPLVWSTEVIVITKNYIQPNEAQVLMNSFLMGGGRSRENRTRQQHVRNHNDRLG